MKICFNYNPHIHFESYKNVLKNVRIHYPESDIFIYFDEFRNDRKKYEEIAYQYNCKFNIRKDEFFYIQQNLGVENAIPRTYEWLMRIKHTCENTDADWLLLLEDDVLIKRKIEKWPNADVGTCRSYFRPGGGAIFKVKSFLKVIENYDLEKLKSKANNRMWMHGDVMLENLFLIHGFAFEEWIELAEPNYRDDIDHAVYHGFKDLHNKKQNRMKDVVIGCITNYTFENIKIFCNSLEQSGFTGYKVMVVYNVPKSTVDELQKRGWIVMSFNYDEANQWYTYKQNFIVTVDRHLHYYLALQQLNEEFGDVRYVIAPDPKDVIFQLNPSEWLEKNIGDKKINVGCESFKYKDEEWGRGNLIESFGEVIYERCKDNLIFNAGTIAGDWKAMSEMFINIYLMCQGSPSMTPDQAAMNVTLSLEPFKSITKFSMSEDSWACQCGTTVDSARLKRYGDKLVEPTPFLDGDMVKTNAGIPFTLVHQYDRIPEWNKILTEKYK